MLKYAIRRLLAIIPILIGISFIVFAMMNIIPGDPGTLMLGDKATQAQKDMLNEQLGYNRPFAERYWQFLTDAVQGDLGDSYRTRQPVMDEIMVRFPKTLRLAVLSLLTAMLIGIPLGILSAVRQYSKIDVISTTMALLIAAIPTFWMGLLLMLLFGVKLKWLPISGYGTFAQIILPALTIGYGCMAIIARMTRSSMLEVINQDYINFAKAKGQKKFIIITKHALQNALIPIITTIALQFGVLLGGSVITESIFAIPGIGKLMVDSIRSSNYPMVMGGVLMIAFIYCINNLLVDIIYAFIDPRIKTSLSNGR